MFYSFNLSSGPDLRQLVPSHDRNVGKMVFIVLTIDI